MGGLIAEHFISLSPIQPQKANPPIETMEFGIATDASPEHPRKAPSPMEMTEFGIITDFKLEQLPKAVLPIVTTEFGIALFLHPAINTFVEDSIIA